MVEHGFTPVEVAMREASWSLSHNKDNALIERVGSMVIPKHLTIKPAGVRNFLEIYDIYAQDEALLIDATPLITEEERELQRFASALEHSKVVERSTFNNKPSLYRIKITGPQCVAAHNFIEDENLKQLLRANGRQYRIAHEMTGNLLQEYENAPIATSRFDTITKKFGFGR